ncbi:hypothetical protein [Bdellovibrio sp. HCB-110]|uniref:hypothetical protein n=1 Tax=Bdellovibrio sp. HCB-110 TaxID=3391182 RepID=UPI0039B67550
MRRLFTFGVLVHLSWAFLLSGCSLDASILRSELQGSSSLIFDKSNLDTTQLSSKISLNFNGDTEVIFEMFEGLQKNKVRFKNLPVGAVLSCDGATGNRAIQQMDVTTEKFFQLQPTFWVATEAEWTAQENQEFSCHYEVDGQRSNDMIFKVHLQESQVAIVSRPAYTGNEKKGISSEPMLSGNGRYIAYYTIADIAPDDENGLDDVYVIDRQTGVSERVSVGNGGVEGNNWSYNGGISEDGRYILFSSVATNLVAGDTNGEKDLFVRDRQMGVTTRVSVDSSGVQANDAAGGARLSGDGRYIAFESNATNLVAGDTNGQQDIFVHDRQTGSTTRVSVDSSGTQANNDSYRTSISGDGRYVTFVSDATNLVAGDTNGRSDIFVHDRQTGATTRVSVDSSGVQADLYSNYPSISADGRYVGFHSSATNLVTGDTNGWPDVFVHDRQTGVTSRVSVDSSGAQANQQSTSGPVLSADGRYVAFQSIATNLVSGDTNSNADVFLHDRQTGATTLVALNSSGVQANSSSVWPSFSADGRYIAFESDATNLVAGDTNGGEDVFIRDLQAGVTSLGNDSSLGTETDNDSDAPSLSADGRYVAYDSWATNLVAEDPWGGNVVVHDRQTGVTTLVSKDSNGVVGNNSSSEPSISADGRYVAFLSSATNLVASDTNNRQDVFVHDRQTGVTTRVSVDSSGVQANNNSYTPSISGDGRYVSFGSLATNLIAGDTNGQQDIFVHDRQTGLTTRVSVDSSGVQANSFSFDPQISGDGRYVAFYSAATNLVVGDTNGSSDIFVHDRQTGLTTRVSVDSSGVQANSGSDGASISGDGRYISFSSSATNLIAGDTNGKEDIFVHDRQTGQTTLVSVASGGVQGDDDSFGTSRISGDGRYVAFLSFATNLVAGDTNADLDVFVHDRQTGVTTRMSVGQWGAQNNDYNIDYLSISPDGRYVAFGSYATNLVPRDTNDSKDILVCKTPQ